MDKDREKLLEAMRKVTTYEGIPIRLKVNLSLEIMEAKRQWKDIFKVLKKKKNLNQELHMQKIIFQK